MLEWVFGKRLGLRQTPTLPKVDSGDAAFRTRSTVSVCPGFHPPYLYFLFSSVYHPSSCRHARHLMSASDTSGSRQKSPTISAGSLDLWRSLPTRSAALDFQLSWPYPSF